VNKVSLFIRDSETIHRGIYRTVVVGAHTTQKLAQAASRVMRFNLIEQSSCASRDRHEPINLNVDITSLHCIHHIIAVDPCYYM
jgi:hypothetical protein